MATTVYKVEELILDDGSVITCKPANIKVLRKGTEMLDLIGEAEDNDEGVRRILDVVVLCLKRQRPEFEKEITENVKVSNEDEDPVVETRTRKVPDYDLLEELFDLETMFKVIEIFLGVKLNDPKLLEATVQLAELRERELAGQS